MAAMLSLSAYAGGVEGALRLRGGVGLDTNARRDFLETGVDPDLVFSGRLGAEGRVSEGPGEVWGSYDVGVRKFATLASEDSLAQAAVVEGSLGLLRWLRAGVECRAKDRWRGGARSYGEHLYSDLAAEGFLELRPGPRVEARVRAGGHRFLYWPVFEYSFKATELSASARYRFDRRHSVFASGEVGFRAYNAAARGETEPPPDLGRRRDVSVGGQGGYSYRGPFSLSLTYGYVEQASNSFGESLARHRVSLAVGFRLPFKLMLLGVLAYQETRYPDGIYLSPELTLLDDDEGHNEVSLRLVRPLSERVDLELTYALFQNALPRNGLTYLRQVGGVGLALRL